MQYQRPVLGLDGTYKAYYQNIGETFSNGRFELNEAKGMFLVKWENGNEWSARYTKKTTTTNVHDDELGYVTEICYTGVWVDDYSICELCVLQTKDKECVVVLRSGKAIDSDKGMDAWKKIFRFYTHKAYGSRNKENVTQQQVDIKSNDDDIIKDKIYDGNELSECAKFIGNPSDLKDFYIYSSENRFAVMVVVDNDGSVRIENDKRYACLSPIDTSALLKKLKFSPAKILINRKEFLVKSAILISFSDLGDGIHFPRSVIATGLIRNSNNFAQFRAIEPKSLRDTILRKVSLSSLFNGKRQGSYQFNYQTINFKARVSIQDAKGGYCALDILNEIAVQKNIMQIYGQGEVWQLAF